jgi:predicted ATPase/DNA-binding SARP family transcriptional activator
VGRAVQVGILGPLEVAVDGAPVEVMGGRLRTLLTRLAMDAGRPVDAAALVDAVWGAAVPTDEANALQSLVSRLRRGLGDPGMVRQSGGGYLLAVAPDDVDAQRFTRLAHEGSEALRTGQPDRAVALLDEAAALWRGPALADAMGAEFAGAAASRYDDLRVRAATDRLQALVDLGRSAEALADLETLAREHPLDERIAALLVTALADQGRQAHALAAYARIRDELAASLGVDPGAGLRDAHLRVLRGEPAAAATDDEADDRPARRTNLRAALSSFVGRDADAFRLGQVLDANRLVTLVGPGGAGKTRLATEVMASRLDSVADGVWIVELAPVTDPAAVAPTVLGALGLRESTVLDRTRTSTPSRDSTARLVDGLADREVVIVLDNCEHLVDAAARLADHLLAQCSGLRILATSREPLGIVGEVLVGVGPLASPDSAEPEAALASPAVRLFLDRAAAVRRDGPVTDDELPTVVEIVRRLDGLPLAIELAAARLRALPLADVASRLDDRFRLLTGGSRTALPRHRTLRAVVEWSWELLSDPERLLLERLAVFPAGATLESAAAVCAGGGVDADDVLDLLAQLVDKSLLQQHQGAAGVRYRLLETIREYGLEQLAASGTAAELRLAHAHYFAELLSRSAPALHGPDQLVWLRQLRDERDNLIAALGTYCDIGDAAGALSIAVPSASLAMQLGDHADAVGWLESALAVPGDVDPELHAVASALLVVHLAASDTDTALIHDHVALLDEAAVQLQSIDVSRYPMVAILRPVVAMFRHDPDLDRIIDDALDSPDPWVAAVARLLRTGLADNVGDPAATQHHAELALEQFRVIGDRWGISSALCAVAQQHTYAGEHDRAAGEYAEAIELIREIGSTEDESRALIWLADLRVRQGDLAAARRTARHAVALTEASGSQVQRTFTLAIAAFVERLAGDLTRARELQRQVLDLLDRLPTGHPATRHGEAMALGIAAGIDLSSGDTPAAASGVARAFTAALGTEDMPIVAAIGVVIADVALAVGLDVTAAEALGAATALRGTPDPTGPDIARLSAVLRDRLGDAGLREAMARSGALDRDAAIERLRAALAETGEAAGALAGSGPPSVAGQG